MAEWLRLRDPFQAVSQVSKPPLRLCKGANARRGVFVGVGEPVVANYLNWTERNNVQVFTICLR